MDFLHGGAGGLRALCAMAGRATLIAALALGFVLSWRGPSTALAAGTLVDVVGNLPLADYNTNIASLTYKDWGNEPFIAVNPLNHKEIVVSGFAYRYGVLTRTGPGNNGSLWVSNDGGASWNTRFTINAVPPLASPPPGSNGPNGPHDQVFAYDNSGVLHAAILSSYVNSSNAFLALSVYHGTTLNPNNTGSFTWSANPVSLGAIDIQADQPWITTSGNRTLVAYDVFGPNTSVRANLSTDGGATFTQDLPISNGFNSSVNPGLRVNSDSLGEHYAIWGVGQGGSPHPVTYHLNRLRPGQSSWDFIANPTADGSGGLVIDSGISTQINNSSLYFGGKNDLRGNITDVAADATGSHVYAVYGKQDVSSVDRIWLAEFHPVGPTLVERPLPVALSVPGKRAALPSVAVTANGTIGVLYLTAPATDTFEVHFAQSTNLGLSWTDNEIYSFSTVGFNLGSTSFPSTNRLLGDYLYLETLGNTFYGTFPGTGNTNAGGINTTDKIVPFFYSVAVPEPSTLVCLLIAAIGITVTRRRPLLANFG